MAVDQQDGDEGVRAARQRNDHGKVNRGPCPAWASLDSDQAKPEAR